LLESIADDGKDAIQSNDVDSTIEMLAFATRDMLSIYQHYLEMLFMDGMAHIVYFIGLPLLFSLLFALYFPFSALRWLVGSKFMLSIYLHFELCLSTLML